ncbi:MAG: DUF262 domain-containing HNH endonuclease family protein [Chloroflexi bacterium]|nr:DUF262 domain-containing HNH endonuclease family protein [Chloroflexota bacterium]
MDARIVNLQTLFLDQVSYQIPQFQRAYAWGKGDQWFPLWEDVRNVAERHLNRDENDRVKPHFMGAIVLQHRKSNTGEVTKRLVVDGQQRLTTLQLLIKATQRVFQQVNDNERAERLRGLTENQKSHWGNDDDNQTKIRQSNRNDQRAFQEAIRVTFIDDRGNYMPITQAFRYFKQKVECWLEDGSYSRVAKSDALEETLTEDIQIAVIDLDDDERPHIIFETLNARGEPLKQSDLVKNTVMYEADVVDEAHEADRLWGMFEDEWWRKHTGESRLDRIQLDRYLNHWMVMRTRKDVSHQRVAAEFREFLAIGESLDIDGVASDIRSTGVIYKSMLEIRDSDFEAFLKRLRILDISAVMPLLLWLRTSGTPDALLVRCFEIIESYLMRRMLCGLTSQGLSRFLIGLLESLYQERSTRYDVTLVNHFNSATSGGLVWPNNRMLLDHLNGSPMSGTIARRRMVLEAIELDLRSDKTERLLETDKLTLEHIMPQKWETHWPLPSEGSSQDAIARMNQVVRYLGNLTLTTNKLNVSLSNGPWNEKRQELEKHSVLLLNKTMLADSSVWNEEAIYQRTSKLAGRITEIWKPAEYFIETSNKVMRL